MKRKFDSPPPPQDGLIANDDCKKSNTNTNRKVLFTTQSKQSSLFVIDRYVDRSIVDHIKTLTLVQRPEMQLYGRTVRENRNVGFFSDESKGYFYSRKWAVSKPLTEPLRLLMKRLNDDLNTDFNGILINHYEDGRNNIGAHRDSQEGLARNGMVAAITLGQSRILRIRELPLGSTTVQRKFDVETKDGQLLVMDGLFQKECTHEIPIQKTIVAPRWSLTFRSHRV
jgi:alkylated DNA repair dioxygenase AlkB